MMTSLGGSFTIGKTWLTVNRMGYGAMQLAGPGIWGPPEDPEGAVLSIQLLRRRLRLKAIEVLPADQAAQRHLTAAQESEQQQADRVLTRRRGLSLGAPAPHTQATYFFKLP